MVATETSLFKVSWCNRLESILRERHWKWFLGFQATNSIYHCYTCCQELWWYATTMTTVCSGPLSYIMWHGHRNLPFWGFMVLDVLGEIASNCGWISLYFSCDLEQLKAHLWGVAFHNDHFSRITIANTSIQTLMQTNTYANTST